MAGRHLRIAEDLGAMCGGETVELNVPSPDDAPANRRGVFRFAGGSHLFIVHGGNIDVDVDTIKQWPRYLGHIALDHGRGAVALARTVIEVATGTGIHCG